MMTLKQKIRKFLRVVTGIENYYQNEDLKYFSNWDYKSPIDNYIQDSYKFFIANGLYHTIYRNWRVTRIKKILKIFGTEWFKGKKVLELGSGLGEMGAFFAELGADVLCVEGRKENVDFANLKYRHLKSFKCVQRDLDESFSFPEKFDLVICFGLIEVIKNINSFIDSLTKISNRILVDTLICDSNDINYKITIKSKEDLSNYLGNDDNLNGNGIVKYTSQFIENCFANKGFSSERFDHSDLNTKAFIYDWKQENKENYKKFYFNNYRRFWLFTKKKKTNSDHREE